LNISKDSVVSIHYTLTDDQKQVLDSSSGKEPLVYIHGSGSIIPGLEQALEGKSQGEKLKVTILPEDAYGPRHAEMVQNVLKSEFQDADKIHVGMRFQVNTQGGPLVLTVIEVKETEVVVDGNHPLAGMTLHFDVEVTDIRTATEEELAHGHVHGEGGHHH
jgi:FKBP-type peptidyl-prolyl cis-trans isomerase SlyD